MKKWSISKKLWALSIFTLINILILSGVNFYFTKQLSNSVSELGEKQIKAIHNMTLADMMHDALRAATYSSIVFADKPEKLMEAKKEYEEYSENFYAYLKKISELTAENKEIKDALKITNQKVDGYVGAGNKIIQLAINNKPKEAIEATDKFIVTFNQLTVEMEALGEMIQKQVDGTVAESNNRVWLANTIGLTVMIGGILLSLLFSYFNNKQLVTSLSKIIRGLKEESAIVTQTSKTVADVSGKLSEASIQQSASLQETVASIDEISAMVSRNSDSAISSAKSSETTTLSAQKGKDKVEQMLVSIKSIALGNDEILQQMQKSNREITDIVKVIQEISEKTKVINDIVFQTKLLSFNASVEAARAGEHGKGFAVVAEEVGNLASMSGKAADEISDMLSKSVKKVTDIVEGTKDLMDNLIRQSKQKIEYGSNTAHECAQALDEILSNVSSVNEMVREISVASHEQSTGVREVNKAMSELDLVTQTNSTIAQESSETAQDLKLQSNRLGKLILDLTLMVEGSNSQFVHE